MRVGHADPPAVDPSLDPGADEAVPLPAPAAQLKPRTPLGICAVCAGVVYSGDALAIAGCRVHHAGCRTVAEPP